MVPNPGNAGDALINHAIYSLLVRRGISFSVEVPPVRRPCGHATYVIAVNGGLGGGEGPVDQLVENLSAQRANMILLSATICNRVPLLYRLPDTTVIFAREPVTHEYVRSARSAIDCVLSEDATMAIADGDADFPRPGYLYMLRYLLRSVLKARYLGYPAHRAVSLLAGSGPGPHVLHAMRNDDESLGPVNIEPGNIDLSAIVCARDQRPNHAEACAGVFLNALRSQTEVYTDRLHVAIACGLLGVNCLLSPNSYFKCSAVYEHSVRHRFPHVRWAATPPH